MAHVALYRKYRPHTFKNLVGQDHIKNTLVNALKSESPSHAYLFCGPRGTGKTSTARLIAKALNCEKLEDGHEPCNECEFCTSIDNNNLIDIIEIDAASNRGIDEIRDLKEKIQFAPSRAKSKIYIIDEVHMMTKEAFNALLKTLEEPPAYVYFILATTEVHKIPDTIISRCQRFDFKRIDEKALMTRLSYIAQLEDIKAEDKAVEAIALHVEGGLRDAIQFLEQLTIEGKLTFEHVQSILGISDFETLDKLFDALNDEDADRAVKLVQDVHSQGYDLNQFCHDFIASMRKRLLTSVSDNQADSTAKYLRIIEKFQKAKDQLKSFSIPVLPLEMAAISAVSQPVVEVASVAAVAPARSAPAPAPKAAAAATPPPAPAPKAEAVPEPKAEPAEKPKAETPTETGSASPLTISHVKENWPRITERIDIPAAKRSLMDANIAQVDGHEVTLEFSSNFHRNKVMEHENRIVVEQIFKEFFNQEVKILSITKDIKLGSTVTTKADDRPHEGISADSSKKAPDLADQALEVFGGEFMEEEE
jgi:DNA polymerase III subunit gamma/tau